MFSPIIIKKVSLLLWNGTPPCKHFTHSILSEFSALQPTDHTNFSLIFQHFIANSLPAFKYSSFLILKLFNIPTNPYVPLQQQIFFFFPPVPSKIYKMMDIILLVIFKKFKLKDKCFTEFCDFLSYINKNQP